MDKLLSVIIPAYNCESTIKQAIMSTGVYQSDNVEVIVVNNGSTDNTKLIVKEEALNNKNIIYRESKKGVSNARNKGIETAKGEWISFLDADDCFINYKDNKIHETLLKSKYDLLIYNYLVGQSKIDLYSMIKEVEHSKIIMKMLENPTKFLTVWGKFYRTSMIKENNIRFNKLLRYSEDSEFLIRYLLASGQIEFNESYIYKYNLSENSTVRSYNPQLVAEYEKAIKQIKIDLENYPTYKYSLSVFILMQINLIMVHNIFISNGTNRIGKLKSICKKNYVRDALNSIGLRDAKNIRLLPLLLCKYHMYIFASLIYKIRIFYNEKSIKNDKNK
ncbi:glycosyltransferase [Lactobacillus reuteri]|uniref:Glycosyltransferase n=1 Tax=Limosilactobacillus reuteri TaxID=1598 RepID=A0A7X2KJQ3_LIMRT|nr:glycosyltransferase family 2 protein [Limosilactobacillus reuteri]MRH72854.1 glycosyltransferase [Limosilactobacillus reuteri]MRH80944.1 glycosyltransferase [Limosilactobacillus reuteri]